jgi:hypothetical protein
MLIVHYLLIFSLLTLFQLNATEGPPHYPFVDLPRLPPYPLLQPPPAARDGGAISRPTLSPATAGPLREAKRPAAIASSMIPTPPSHLLDAGGADTTAVPMPSSSSSPAQTKVTQEDYTPEGHPVLSNSSFARRYIECSTICCFVSEKWFRTGAFLATVGTVVTSAIAYGVPDGDSKNNLILASLVIHITGTALSKFANYAHLTVNNDENQFKMFKPAPPSKG